MLRKFTDSTSKIILRASLDSQPAHPSPNYGRRPRDRRNALPPLWFVEINVGGQIQFLSPGPKPPQNRVVSPVDHIQALMGPRPDWRDIQRGNVPSSDRIFHVTIGG